MRANLRGHAVCQTWGHTTVGPPRGPSRASRDLLALLLDALSSCRVLRTAQNTCQGHCGRVPEVAAVRDTDTANNATFRNSFFWRC